MNMGRRKRQRIDATDVWQQLHLLTTSVEQYLYELIRPIVLFGHSPAERARQTGAAERTRYRQAARFEANGMSSLFATSEPGQRRTLPVEIRQAIRELKAEHPALRAHEIATICATRFGRRPSPHTVKRILAEEPPLPLTRRRFPPYHQIIDPAERRLAVVCLHSEGWRITSIAGYLGIDRHTIYAVLRRWIDEGVLGLDDKSRARKPGVRKVNLQAMALVREMQENPELGACRVHAALKQVGIELSPRTCGRILALNRKLYVLGTPTRTPHVPKEIPFKATRRHQYWTVDICYLDHALVERNVYCMSILENYSRSILASAISRKQDLTAYLMVLYAAVRQHGAPEALVSDSGGVFRATQALRIYDALGIRKEQIDRRQSWQSYIETQFNVQWRMADWHFAQATSWLELLAAHDRWAVDFNYLMHLAHRERQDGRHSPVEVLDWFCSRQFPSDALHRIFYATRFERKLNQAGYVRFRHWRLYGERGLAGEQAVVWLYREQLTVAFADEALDQYQVTYQPDDRHLAAVTAADVFETPYRSPQPSLWEWGDGEWLTVVRVTPYAPRQPRRPATGIQPRLFHDEDLLAASG